MKKVLLALFTVAALVALAGCAMFGGGGDDGGATFTEDGLMLISVGQWEASDSFGEEPCDIYLYIQERFGITFETMDLSWENFYELPLLWAAADDLPDIIGGVDMVNGPTFREWIDAGLIRSLPSDLSRWPNIANWIRQEYVQDLAVNGEIYFFPRGHDPNPEIWSTHRALINRRDWRENLGIPLPETEEDVLNMWRAFASNDVRGDGHQVFGFITNGRGWLLDQAFAGHGDTRGVWTLRPDGQMVIPAFERTALPLMAFYRQAFQEGLIDPDFITNPSGAGITEFAMGNVGTLLLQAVPRHMHSIYIQWQDFQPHLDFVESIEILVPPSVPGKERQYFKTPGGFWSETFFSSRVTDEMMERIMDFYDWKSSEEGSTMMVFGFEGRDFEFVDGELVITTPIGPDGEQLSAFDLYQYIAGGMQYLVGWPSDAVEWFDPFIPIGIREMATANRDRLFAYNNYVFTSGRINAINLDAVLEMGLPGASDEWIAFMTDSSDLTHEELWETFNDRWMSIGYGTARELMTAEVEARGYR